MNLSRRAFATAALALPVIAHAEVKRLRIGYQKIGSLALMRQQKRLDPLGIAAEWIEFPSGPPLMEALNAGAIDFGYAGDTPPIFALAAGADLLYVAAQPVIGRNEGVLVPADSPITSVAGLRGRRVAFTKGSSAHYMIVRVLGSAGLTLADVTPVMLAPPDGAAAFRSRGVDAWAVWDPFFAVAEIDPANRVLTNADGIAPSNSFFLARRAFARGEPALVASLIDAINETAAWAAANPVELTTALSKLTGVPLEAERVAAPRGTYVAVPMSEAIVAQEQAIADLFARLRIIPSRVDIAAAVWRPETKHAEARP